MAKEMQNGINEVGDNGLNTAQNSSVSERDLITCPVYKCTAKFTSKFDLNAHY